MGAPSCTSGAVGAGRLALTVALGAVAVACCLPAMALAESPCTTDAGDITEPGKRLKKRVKLISDRPAEVVNWGRKRDDKEIDVVLTATPRLPATFDPKSLEIYVPRRFLREGDKLETKLFQRPMFSSPRIRENGTRVTFTMCLDPGDVDAGAYLGEIDVAGPRGLDRTVIPLSANLKDWNLFRAGLVLAILAALGLLAYKPIQGLAGSDKRKAIDVTVGSLRWWVETIASLTAAVIAASAIYAQDPAWGDELLAGIVALGGAAFAAAGVQSLIGTVRRIPEGSSARSTPKRKTQKTGTPRSKAPKRKSRAD